jgi:hypothetical protein
MLGNGESVPSSVVAEGSEHRAETETILASAREALDAILALAESAKSQVAALAEDQRQSTAAIQATQERLDEINGIATQLVGIRTQIADDQTVVATKSAHIQSAQEHADKVRAELDRTLTSANQQLTEAEGCKARAQSASDTATELLTSVRAAKATAETDSTSTTAARDTARTAADDSKALADKANTIEERLAEYEATLARLKGQSESQLKTIVGLLPGATSAGLAHAFDVRRQTFINPRKRWQWVFVVSVLALVAIASTGLWHVLSSRTLMTYDDVLRLWLSRLPVAGALVWLALHASRESALAKRLEEDYGYKAAIASSFQGFHKQMSEVGENISVNAPLAKLCADTLTTIATPPGRIYEAHGLTTTPTTEIADAVKDAMGSAADQK